MSQSQHEDHLQALSEIRSLMEKSSRFISLSGLSGVAAGVSALLGAMAAYIYLGISPFERKMVYISDLQHGSKTWGLDYLTFFIGDAALVLLLAIASGIYFTTRKARSKGQKVWDATSQRVVINLLIPLVTGGIFCIALFFQHLYGLIAPATLVFYGLALVNGGKYTLNDIRYLGITEIALGLLAMFYIGYELEFWATGFGVLHIVYGLLMYQKYK